MKQDIILAGVGGQGILTVAFLLDSAALRRGWRIKQAEVHGMAQRGGAVYSHLRISDTEVISDTVPLGAADMVLSVEPLEVQRYVQYLRPDGVVIASREPYKNIPDYPADDAVLRAVLALPRAVLVDAKGIAEGAGVPKAQNMAMVGAATPFLPFDLADFQPIVQEMFATKGDRVIAANMAALEAGCQAGAACKALLDKGVPSAEAARIVAQTAAG